jgi:hypothetical protein
LVMAGCGNYVASGRNLTIFLMAMVLDGLVEVFDRVWCRKLTLGRWLRGYDGCKTAEIPWSEIVHDS